MPVLQAWHASPRMQLPHDLAPRQHEWSWSMWTPRFFSRSSGSSAQVAAAVLLRDQLRHRPRPAVRTRHVSRVSLTGPLTRTRRLPVFSSRRIPRPRLPAASALAGPPGLPGLARSRPCSAVFPAARCPPVCRRSWCAQPHPGGRVCPHVESPLASPADTLCAAQAPMVLRNSHCPTLLSWLRSGTYQPVSGCRSGRAAKGYWRCRFRA